MKNQNEKKGFSICYEWWGHYDRQIEEQYDMACGEQIGETATH